MFHNANFGYLLVAGSVGCSEYNPNGVLTFTEAGAYPDPNDPANYGQYFDGTLDDIRVYERLLTVGQIRKLAANEEYIKVRNSYTYNPYGEDFASEVEETVYNPFKFTGQWYDVEISQYYLRARQYDPQLMRFSGRDPVKGNPRQTMSLHRYLYCLNDPVNRG